MKNKPLFIFFGALALGTVTQAQAADGCKFMLCMGAVNPMGIAECAPTIKDVLKDLRKGHGFPTCKMSDGRDSRVSGSYINYRKAPMTPPCPQGTKQGSPSIMYHAGAKPSNMRYSPFTGWTNLTEGVTTIPAQSLLVKNDYSQRVCVSGSKLASIAPTSYVKGGERYTTPAHEWWSNLQVIKPDGATYEFDFFIENALYSNHRF